MKAVFILSTMLVLSACQNIRASESELAKAATEATQPVLPAINTRLVPLGQTYSAVPIFDLTEQQTELFLSAFHHELANLPPHHRLAEYLRRLTSTYNYRERTLTASEAFDGIPGNCMSLVVLTTALAGLVDLDIDHQRLSTNPIFDKQQGIVLVSDHIRSRVFAPKEEGVFVLRRGHVTIDYFPTRGSRRAERLNLDQLLAMYYSNRAAESILDNELTTATHFASLALEHSPKHASAYNLLAILHKRIDDTIQAETFFQQGLQHSPEDLNILNNYHILLVAQSRHDEADDIQQRIAVLNDVNPYQLIALAQRAFENDEPRQALVYYEQALEVAPYLHEIYLQQAVVLESMGRGHRANKSLHEGLAQARLAANEANYKRRMSAVKMNSENAW